METIEKNKLIAEFEGHIINYGFNKDGVLFYGHHISVNKLKYHTSWDWLMPVIEKIEYMLHDDIIITIEYKTCIIPVVAGTFNIMNDSDGFDIVCNSESKIEACYNAVIQFIEWYNQNKDATFNEVVNDDIDLFEHIDILPNEVKSVIEKYGDLDDCYDIYPQFLAELEQVGYTFDYYLDAEPYNLRKIKQ